MILIIVTNELLIGIKSNRDQVFDICNLFYEFFFSLRIFVYSSRSFFLEIHALQSSGEI